MAKKTEAAEPAATPGKFPSRFADLLKSDTIRNINKAYKADAITIAAETKARNVPRHSTGIFQLDYATGGGITAGDIHTFYGGQSSGKTTSCLKTVGIAQDQCANCWSGSFAKGVACNCGDFRECVASWINAEGTWDQKWASANGVDLNRLIFNTPDYGEKAFDIAEMLLRGDKDSGGVDFLVMDSLAFLVPKNEVEKSLEEGVMGEQPRMIGRGIRKMLSALNMLEEKYGRRPTILFTNQIRMKLGVMFGNPETTPGGNAPRFASTTEVRFAQGKTACDEKTGKPLYVDLRFKVEKNKSAPMAKYDGEYRLVMSEIENKVMGSVWDEPEMIRLAEVYGHLTGGGGSYTLFGQKYKGKTDLEQQLTYNPEFKREIWGKLMGELLK